MYEGMAKGVANVQQYVRDEERREAENAMLRQQTYQANSQLLKQQTYDALNRFEADGDARHLNTFLADAKRNPVGAKIYGSTVRMDNLYKSSEVDDLLRQAGYHNPEEVYTDPDNGLLLATTTEGLQLVPKERYYATTGYTNYMSDQQLAKMEKQARINQLMQSGQTRANISFSEKVAQDMVDTGKATSISEAYKIMEELKNKGAGTTEQERLIDALKQEEGFSTLEAVQALEGPSYQSNERRYVESKRQEGDKRPESELVAEYRNLGQTTTQKEIGSVEEAKAALDEQNFFDLDVATMKPQERAKLHSQIARIEDLRGIKLTNDDKRLGRDIRNLAQLGGKAGELIGDEEAGLIDSTINSLKSYMFNDIGTTEAKASYESFRNIFRNALYGASLTQAEVEAFNNAMGTLKQQPGPVLKKLNEQMNSLRNQLQSVANYNDPYLAHYYFGTDLDDLDEKIRRIDERAAMISGYSGPGLSTSKDIEFTIKTTEPQVDSTGAPDLNAIWAKSMGGQ